MSTKGSGHAIVLAVAICNVLSTGSYGRLAKITYRLKLMQNIANDYIAVLVPALMEILMSIIPGSL
jgi:hypothetical protein